MERVCSVSDIPAGSMKGFTVNGKQVLVAHAEGSFFAMDAICSHNQGYLPDGTLSGKTVTCPVHGAQYDLATGEVLRNVPWLIKMGTHSAASGLNTYPVTEKDGQVFVEV